MKIKLIFKEKYNKLVNIFLLFSGLAFFYIVLKVIIKGIENYYDWIGILCIGLIGFLFLWNSYKMFKKRKLEKFSENIYYPDKFEVLE